MGTTYDETMYGCANCGETSVERVVEQRLQMTSTEWHYGQAVRDGNGRIIFDYDYCGDTEYGGDEEPIGDYEIIEYRCCSCGDSSSTLETLVVPYGEAEDELEEYQKNIAKYAQIVSPENSLDKFALMLQQSKSNYVEK